MVLVPEIATDCNDTGPATITVNEFVALNCGTRMDMDRAKEAIERYKAVTALPLMAQPNAGQPRLVNMKVIYDQTDNGQRGAQSRSGGQQRSFSGGGGGGRGGGGGGGRGGGRGGRR